MIELLITGLSLVVGAVLASVSGIVVTCWVDKRKEEKELEVFKLEFSLYVHKLYNRLNDFNYAINQINYDYNNITCIESIVSSQLLDKIFFEFRLISKISGIDINRYFEFIDDLKEVDSLIDDKSHPVKIYLKVIDMHNGKAIIKLKSSINSNLEYITQLKEILNK